MEQTVLALTNENLVTIACAATSSPLDESLSRIKAFLTERLNESNRQELSSDASGVLIDLGVLGVQADGNAHANWVNRRVYPIRLYHATVILGPLYNPAHAGGPCPPVSGTTLAGYSSSRRAGDAGRPTTGLPVRG